MQAITRWCAVAFTAVAVEAVNHMEHHVARNAVGPGFGAPLGVDGGRGGFKPAQQVIAVECKHHVALAEGLGDSAVPHQFVGVHVAGGVATAAELCKVGGELHLPGQRYASTHAIVEVGGVDFIKATAVTVGYLLTDRAEQRQVQPVGRAVFEF